jgi:hypothetical protein
MLPNTCRQRALYGTKIAEDIYKQMIAQRQSRKEQYSTKLP